MRALLALLLFTVAANAQYPRGNRYYDRDDYRDRGGILYQVRGDLDRAESQTAEVAGEQHAGRSVGEAARGAGGGEAQRIGAGGRRKPGMLHLTPPDTTESDGKQRGNLFTPRASEWSWAIT